MNWLLSRLNLHCANLRVHSRDLRDRTVHRETVLPTSRQTRVAGFEMAVTCQVCIPGAAGKGCPSIKGNAVMGGQGILKIPVVYNDWV